MFTLELNPNGETPMYQELYEHIKEKIEMGQIKAGEKLPSKRSLSSHLKISINTIESAYAQLVAEGYIVSKAGSGFYAEDIEVNSDSEEWDKVCDEERESDMLYSATPEIKYDFRTNRIDTSDFPFATWAKLSREVLSEQNTDLLNACEPQGTLALRTSIAEYLKNFRGFDVSPEQIVVGAGSEYLLERIIQLIGRDNAYGVENPGYKKIFQIFSANASRVFPIPMDEKGASAEAISNFGINVLHITPSHHFPLGIVMPVTRRQELLKWAYVREDRFIIEDDYDSEFRYTGKPIPTLQSMDKKGRVIYINSFTKSLAPSMRISYMVLPKELCRTFVSKLGFYSCTVPAFEQYTLAKFMSEGYFERHINRMKKIYKQRRDVLVENISKGKLNKITEVLECSAGMHMLIRVHNGMSQNELIRSAMREGVKVYGISEYYSFPVVDMANNMIVMGFSGLNEKQIAEGILALEKAWLK